MDGWIHLSMSIWNHDRATDKASRLEEHHGSMTGRLLWYGVARFCNFVQAGHDEGGYPGFVRHGVQDIWRILPSLARAQRPGRTTSVPAPPRSYSAANLAASSGGRVKNQQDGSASPARAQANFELEEGCESANRAGLLEQIHMYTYT